MKSVIAFDPGPTTAYAFRIGGQVECRHFAWQWEHNFLKDKRDRMSIVDVYVIERYIVRPQTQRIQSGDMETSEILGWLRGQAIIGFNRPVILQLPSDQTTFNDETLKALDLYPSNRHERSAMKHLLHYLYKQNDEWLLTLVQHRLGELL